MIADYLLNLSDYNALTVGITFESLTNILLAKLRKLFKGLSIEEPLEHICVDVLHRAQIQQQVYCIKRGLIDEWDQWVLGLTNETHANCVLNQHLHELGRQRCHQQLRTSAIAKDQGIHDLVSQGSQLSDVSDHLSFAESLAFEFSASNEYRLLGVLREEIHLVADCIEFIVSDVEDCGLHLLDSLFILELGLLQERVLPHAVVNDGEPRASLDDLVLKRE